MYMYNTKNGVAVNSNSVFSILFTNHYLKMVKEPLKDTVFAFPL